MNKASSWTFFYVLSNFWPWQQTLTCLIPVNWPSKKVKFCLKIYCKILIFQWQWLWLLSHESYLSFAAMISEPRFQSETWISAIRFLPRHAFFSKEDCTCVALDLTAFPFKFKFCLCFVPASLWAILWYIKVVLASYLLPNCFILQMKNKMEFRAIRPILLVLPGHYTVMQFLINTACQYQSMSPKTLCHSMV